jgi:hypothetical protein
VKKEKAADRPPFILHSLFIVLQSHEQFALPRHASCHTYSGRDILAESFTSIPSAQERRQKMLAPTRAASALAFSFAVLLTGVLTPAAHGAVIARYTFGSPGQETTVETSPAFAPTTVAPGVTATPVTDPAGTVAIEISSAPAGTTVPPGAPFLRIDPQGNSASAPQAITNNKYFQFIITPDAGAELDLTSLTFDVARGGGSTPRGVVVRSSADNFAANLLQQDIGTARPTYTPVSIDLSGASFQNLTAPLTFRVYSYSPAAGSSLDYDNFTLNGVVVPEPAAAGLALVAGLGLLARRRGK